MTENWLSQCSVYRWNQGVSGAGADVPQHKDNIDSYIEFGSANRNMGINPYFLGIFFFCRGGLSYGFSGNTVLKQNVYIIMYFCFIILENHSCCYLLFSFSGVIIDYTIKMICLKLPGSLSTCVFNVLVGLLLSGTSYRWNTDFLSNLLIPHHGVGGGVIGMPFVCL